MDNYDQLFGEFGPVTTEAWKEKILQDLKECSFEKLIWTSPEGFQVRPFYREEDLKGLEYLKDAAIHSDGHNAWEIRQDVMVKDFVEANCTALDALRHGATSLGFIIPDESVIDEEGMQVLLKDIYIDCININFITTLQSESVFRSLADYCEEKGIDPATINGSINTDPLGYLTTHGDYPGGIEKAFEHLAGLIKEARVKMPGMRITGVNGKYFAEAGAYIPEEIAFSMAVISEYLDRLSSRAISVDDISRSMQLNFSAGPAYFMEIAKLRAVRHLFAKLVKSWGPANNASLNCYIHSVTASWNQTVFDPNVNMLRATTESMAAVIGGTDSLTVSPFDRPFRHSTFFSERIARNTQIILKEEASMDKVADPAAGSYFIENLTDSIVTGVWELFLQVEEKGGYLKALEEGFIQERIQRSASRRDQDLATRKEILLGTNQYPNSGESVPAALDSSIAFPVRMETIGKLIRPIHPYRGAQTFEHLRIKTLQQPEKPVVFLLTYGNRNWRKARATFAANFFACASFDILDNAGFTTIGEGLEAAFEKKASIIVLCSSDEEYMENAPEVLKKIGNRAILVVAGYPKDTVEALKRSGVENFIHVNSNVIDELRKYQKLLGIE